MSALKTQVAGSHYKDLAIQPVEYIHANKMEFIPGSVVKYITRYKSKGGIDDLRKARHFIDILIELETKHELKAEAERTMRAVMEYCTSEQYDKTGDVLHDDSWREDRIDAIGRNGNDGQHYDVFAPSPICEHETWFKYVSTKTRVCTTCGYEQPLSDNAGQVEHKRKSVI